MTRPLSVRLAVAIACAAAAALLRTIIERDPTIPYSSDFAQLWYGARALFEGRDPYTAVGVTGTDYHLHAPLLYPTTALVAVAPFTVMPLAAANVLFVATGVGALAWGLTQRAWWPLWALASAPALLSLQYVQWAPLFTASLLVPPLAVFLGAKPTIGAGLVGAAPGRRWFVFGIVGGVGLALASFALDPNWPARWWAALHAPSEPMIVAGASLNNYGAPIALTGGPLILLALLRWRRPEARLLVTLAVVPQTLVGTELLPLLALVPRARPEALALVALSWGVRLATPLGKGATWYETFRFAGLLSVWLVYLPAVALVLRRPNEGPAPVWMERALAWWQVPPWITGHAEAPSAARADR